MKYNEKYKIKFAFNPVAQCLLGQCFGWLMILELYYESRDYREGDEVGFTYHKSNADKCVNYINNFKKQS